MPEDDRGPLPADLADVPRADVRSAPLALQAGDVPAAVREGVHERSVARADVEDRARRRQSVQAPGEPTAGAAEEGVARPGEPADARTVGPGIGPFELGV